MNETGTNITKNKLKKTITKKLEWDFNVPDYKNDILKITRVCTDGYITHCEIKDGSVFAKICVKATLLYVPDFSGNLSDENMPPKISSLETKETFPIKMELPTGFDYDLEDVSVNISGVVPSVINSRKASVRLNASLTVMLIKNANYCVKVPEDVKSEMKKREISSVYVPVMTSEKIDFSHSFSLPSGKPDIKEVLSVTPHIRNKEVKAVSNKAVVKGDLYFKVLYISPVNTVEAYEYMTPFTEITDAKGINEDMEIMFSLNTKSVDYKIYSNEENSQRNLDVSGYMLFKMTAFCKNKMNVVCDAFCPEYESECVKEELNYTDISKALKDAYTLKESLVCNDSGGEIMEICDLSAYISTKEAIITDDKLNIASVVTFDMVYRANDGIKCEKKIVNFDFSRDIPSDEKYDTVDILSEVSDCSFVITSSNSIEARCNILFETRLFKENSMEIVTELKPDKTKAKKSDFMPVMAYYPGENEELFDIAKRYNTTVDSIKESNNLTEDYVTQGKYIIIDN